jgi:hypothetical protein
MVAMTVMQITLVLENTAEGEELGSYKGTGTTVHHGGMGRN